MASSRTQSSPGACSALLTAAAPPLAEVPTASGVPAVPAVPVQGGRPARGGRPLCGGTANRGRVVRVGDTVVRPTAPCWPATHALLRHLDSAGFDGAPRVLSAGPATETLTYIAGRAAVPPLPDDVLTDEALVSVADLLRRYHRAAASFDPASYAWPRPVPARYRTGLVSHNDVYPANVVFRDGRAVALIDFDLAGPGSAVWDFAAAARLFVPLLDEADIADSRQGRALERFRIFLMASGLPRASRIGVAEALVDNHDWTYAIVTEAAAAGHAGFADHWREVAPEAGRARRWCERHRRALLTAAR
jgi:Phosphotransferase enzyme family